jgi:hypothetical protein
MRSDKMKECKNCNPQSLLTEEESDELGQRVVGGHVLPDPDERVDYVDLLLSTGTWVSGKYHWGQEEWDQVVVHGDMWMNEPTGSVDGYDGWRYEEDGEKLNAVDRDEVSKVHWSVREGYWVAV